MSYGVICFLWSPLLAMSGLVLTSVLGAAWVRGEEADYFLPSIVLIWIAFGLCWVAGRRHKRHIQPSEGAILMAIGWLFLSVVGMLPYGIRGILPWIDCWFEAVAAVTTTGLMTVPAVYLSMPPALSLWRSALAWLGGLQFLAFIVTIVPLISPSLTLSVQGRQNVSFSPMVHPMLGRAAKVLGIYGGITIIAIILYRLVSPSLWDAVIQAGLTVSTTGGVGPLPMDSPVYELVGMIPLILVSGNFLLYLKSWERQSWKVIWRDAEWQVFIASIGMGGLIIAWHLWQSGVTTGASSLIYGIFHILSFMSSTGFASSSMAQWPELDWCLIFTVAFLGTSLASLSGGLRLMRLIVLGKMARNELRRTLHPHMVVSITVNREAVPTRVVSLVLAYFFLFMTTYFVSVIIFTVSGITPLQAMGLSLGCISSVGATAPLFGITDFLALPAWLKFYSAVLMILGRMEIFAVCLLIRHALQTLRQPW